MNDLVFLDTETTGLLPGRHQIWEIAYAIGDGHVLHGFLTHDYSTADPAALVINGYLDRCPPQIDVLGAVRFEGTLKAALNGATIVGANPAFDTAMLYARWGEQPWHYRMIDIESFAMPILGYDRPKGLAGVSEDLRCLGYEIYQADHTARADVLSLRDCWNALQQERGNVSM